MPRTVHSSETKLAEQVTEWLARSCLKPADVPGKLLPEQDARSIEFYTIDGARLPEADILRRFAVPNGFVPNPPEPDPKYLCPKDEPPHLYFPQNGTNNWRAWAADPGQRKVQTEGALKAACANKCGIRAFGIQGCQNYRSKRHGMLLLPEFQEFNLDGTHYYAVPDHDRNPKAVAAVVAATGGLLRDLKERGARPHLVWLPLLNGYEKVGLDDLLHHYSHGGKDLAAARRAFEELLAATPEWQDTGLNDLSNARQWVAMFGADFRYAGKAWLHYERGCWRKDGHLRQQETTKEMFSAEFAQARDMGNTLRLAKLEAHVTAHRIESVGRTARSDPVVVTEPHSFDRHPLLVNCRNGTLVMLAGKDDQLVFRPHNRDDLLTRAVAVDYNPKAECPHFRTAMRFWTHSNAALERTVQQLLGLSCTGVTREQCFMLLFGPSQTGKSTLLEIVRELLGDYAVTLPADTFLVRKHGIPEERKLAPLMDARLATCSETELLAVMDETQLKLVTGEDNIAARKLYEELVNYVLQAKLWIRTNNLPKIREMGNAFWRRVITLPFGQVVPESQKDKFLKEKLRAELEGIFAWMVAGYVDYARNGLVLAPVVQQAAAEYRKEQDAVGRFLEEECKFVKANEELTEQTTASKEVLYRRYRQWCEEQGPHVFQLNKEDFRKELARFKVQERRIWVKSNEKNKDGKPKKTQQRRWAGITLRSNKY